jgi:hypothetical protein
METRMVRQGRERGHGTYISERSQSLRYITIRRLSISGYNDDGFLSVGSEFIFNGLDAGDHRGDVRAERSRSGRILAENFSEEFHALSMIIL